MTDRERYINARKEARRYKRKYLAIKQAYDELINSAPKTDLFICPGDEEVTSLNTDWLKDENIMTLKERQQLENKTI